VRYSVGLSLKGDYHEEEVIVGAVVHYDGSEFLYRTAAVVRSGTGLLD
jgi:hypothetical protein